MERFERLALATITESKSNPRKSYDKARLQELADSIAAKGVVQPIVVRAKGKAKFEIVAGSRRFRASKLAGADTIPAMIRDLTDDEVLEIQIVENAQREDIDPYEEAIGYKALLDRGVLDIAGIASKVSKSEGTIKRRLILATIDASVYAKLREWDAPLAAAELIAALPAEDQLGTAKYWKDKDSWNPPTMRGFREQIRGRSESLRRAPFDTADAELLPLVGACGACPFNTASGASLFTDGDQDPRCIKPSCFAKKAEATKAAKIEDAKARGLTLLSMTHEGSKDILNANQWKESKDKDAGRGIIVECYSWAIADRLFREVRFKRWQPEPGSCASVPSSKKDVPRSERLEQLRGYRSEMIARRRILDAVLEILAEGGEYMAGRLYGDLGYRSALALSALLRGPGTQNVVTSKDPPNGKHPGIDEEWERLGLGERYQSHKLGLEDLLKIELAPETFVRIEFLAATKLEIHVGDVSPYSGWQNHPPLVLTAAANALQIDMAAIRKQADWDTLSKKAQKERLAENTTA